MGSVISIVWIIIGIFTLIKSYGQDECGLEGLGLASFVIWPFLVFAVAYVFAFIEGGNLIFHALVIAFVCACTVGGATTMLMLAQFVLGSGIMVATMMLCLNDPWGMTGIVYLPLGTVITLFTVWLTNCIYLTYTYEKYVAMRYHSGDVKTHLTEIADSTKTSKGAGYRLSDQLTK